MEAMQSKPFENGGIRELAKTASLRLRPLKTSSERADPGTALRFTPEEDEPTSPVTPVGQAFSQPDMNVVILVIVGLAQKPALQHMQEFLRDSLVRHRRFHSVMVRKVSHWLILQLLSQFGILTQGFERTGF